MADRQSSPPKISLPRREFVLSRTDIGRYSDLLVEAFPDIWFIMWLEPREKDLDDPPTILPTQSLVDWLDDSEKMYHFCRIEFGKDWQPQWEKGQFGWSFGPAVYPNGEIELGGTINPARPASRDVLASPEWMAGGSINFRVDVNDKAQVTLARKALRLLGKVASNGCQTVRYPSLEVVNRFKHGNFWIGHDAARWCREKPDRMVSSRGRFGWGTRPLD